jgi:hypothetical protein
MDDNICKFLSDVMFVVIYDSPWPRCNNSWFESTGVTARIWVEEGGKNKAWYDQTIGLMVQEKSEEEKKEKLRITTLPSDLISSLLVW